MKTTKGQMLTNYINRENGMLWHGSELSYFLRFKSGLYKKINSYQCNQNMPYWNGEIIDGKMVIVRWLYGKEVFETYVEKLIK